MIVTVLEGPIETVEIVTMLGAPDTEAQTGVRARHAGRQRVHVYLWRVAHDRRRRREVEETSSRWNRYSARLRGGCY